MSERISKTEAQYKSVSDSLTQRCGTCTMFTAPHTCSLVIGEVSQLGVCKFWEKKK